MINMRVSWLKSNNLLVRVLLILESMPVFTSLDLLVTRKYSLGVKKNYLYIKLISTSLKALDIEVMKHLGSRVNLIPVIAKADTLTPKDLAQYKLNVSLFFFVFKKKLVVDDTLLKQIYLKI